MANPLLAEAAGQKQLLLGNEAIVRGALEAGIQVVSCYPGTPSSEVPDTFFRLSPDADYYFEYSINEKVALEVAGGATLSGALTMCTMKHVGVNVAADPFMTLAYTGTPGGFLLLSADDPGCHSSQNEQDNRYYARLASYTCMEPSTAQEAKDMTRDALAMSKENGVPVMLRTTTRVNHLRGPVEFGALPAKEAAAGFKKNPAQYVPIPAFARTMHAQLLETMEKMRAISEESPYNTVSGEGKVGIIASGISRAYLSDALAELELTGKVKVLELGMTWPLPEKKITEFLASVDTALVLEEVEPLLENDVRVLVQKENLSTKIVGKDSEHLPRDGEFTVAMVKGAVAEVTGTPLEKADICQVEELPMRPPNLCAGCPHRATYYAARQIFGDEAVYSSDIGCYTLGILPPLAAADFLLCMGSSVSAGGGAAKAAGQKVVAFIGDSTFFHSGVTGLINAVYNKHDVLLVILDNRTTAMTGHQPNPGVDKTTLGDSPVTVDIEQVVRGCGVTQIQKVNPLNLKKTKAALQELGDMDGVRVLIAEEPCPLFARRAYGQVRTQIAYVTDGWDESDTVLDDLACPAFYKEDGKMKISEIQCSGCMLCLQVSKNIKAKKKGA
ncbi:MAG: indolepyruvate ferredoxin oxidoreductase subunit alpha [Desulfovibrio sp.]